MIKKIVNVKQPSLRQPSKAVTKIDKKIKALVSDMIETLKAQDDPEGVGLAAPQVGKNLKIFIIGYDGTEKICINPKIIKKSKEKIRAKKDKKNILEGCLSLPHYYSPVSRAKSVTLEYQDLSGETKIEKFDGFFAQIVQHEVDHLDGVIFLDRALEQKQLLYKFKGEEWEEVSLV